MSNPIHHLILARLDSTPAPTVSLRELSYHAEPLWRPLITAGVLVEDDTPEEIEPSPARTLNVKKIGDAYFGFDPTEEFPSPKPLAREDVIGFRVVASGLAAHLRTVNVIDGRNPSTANSPTGLHLIGRKSMPGGVAAIWLAVALGSPDTATGYLATLAQDEATTLHVVVFPVWPDVPMTAVAALSSRGVHVADLDPVSLVIRWPDALRRDAAPTVPEYGFIHEGATWRVHFLGESFTIPDKTGVVYLARLLNDPSNAWTALEVQRGYRTEAPQQSSEKPEDGTELSDLMENPIHASDDQGMARLRRLLTPLRRQLAEAQRKGDVIEEREARAALAKILPGTSQVVGRDDRSRVSGAAEKARKNVSKQINQALAAIEQRREPVARHIRAHLTFGLSMTYSPTRGEAWRVVFPNS